MSKRKLNTKEKEEKRIQLLFTDEQIVVIDDLKKKTNHNTRKAFMLACLKLTEFCINEAEVGRSICSADDFTLKNLKELCYMPLETVRLQARAAKNQVEIVKI